MEKKRYGGKLLQWSRHKMMVACFNVVVVDSKERYTKVK